VARWQLRANSVGKASHHDGWAGVQGESRHTRASVALQAKMVNHKPSGRRTERGTADQSARHGKSAIKKRRPHSHLRLTLSSTSDSRECRSLYPAIAPFRFLSPWGLICGMLAAYHAPVGFSAEFHASRNADCHALLV
jgi:hypothetical protein